MKIKAYRVELENSKGNFCGCLHFITLEEAEKFLINRKYLVDYKINAIPNNKRYGTIWETTLTA